MIIASLTLMRDGKNVNQSDANKVQHSHFIISSGPVLVIISCSLITLNYPNSDRLVYLQYVTQRATSTSLLTQINTAVIGTVW